ncbi:MAG TPA: MFS transporter, partial [Agromyces sp.]|nr:MFS transporter [Agromyces sp.]
MSTTPTSPPPDTGSLPAVDPSGDDPHAADAAASAAATAADRADGTRGPSLARRVAASLADPVLRILVIATLISRVGRGVFLTVTVLYLTLIVGLEAFEVAIVLGAASAAGVFSSLAGGWLADRMSARRLLLALSALEGLVLISYVFAHDFVSALVIAVLVGGIGQATNSTRMAIIA